METSHIRAFLFLGRALTILFCYFLPPGPTDKAIEKNLRAEVAYLPEDDIHFPTMTVGQTLDFAAATRAPQAKRRITLGTETESREDYIKMVKEVLLTILGLRETTDVKVGNDLVRGVSGGQRKRVSVAEQMALRSKVNLWDNVSQPEEERVLSQATFVRWHSY